MLYYKYSTIQLLRFVLTQSNIRNASAHETTLTLSAPRGRTGSECAETLKDHEELNHEAE